MTTVHGISNIKDIAILAYNGNLSFIQPDSFNESLAGQFSNTMNSSDSSCSDWAIDAQRSYLVTNFDKIIRDSYLTGEGDYFDINNGASHDNDNEYYGCSKFWNLFADNRMVNEKQNLYDKKFKKFNENNQIPENWIGNEKGRYSSSKVKFFRQYWRVYYRTWDDYYDLIKCGKISFDFNSYINNDTCKYYLDNKNTQLLSTKCIEKSLSDDQLLNICQPLLLSDKIDTSDKSKINNKLLNYCSQSDRLINDSNCKKFWNLDYNNYYKQSDKLEILDPVARNLCKNGHKYYPFCNCINNQKEDLTYINSKNEIQKVDDSCLSVYCNEKSYKLSDHKEKLCPNVCIQTVYGAYSTIKDVELKCDVNAQGGTVSQNPSVNIPPTNTLPTNTPPTTTQTPEKNNIINNPETIKKTSLFNLKNNKIKIFMTKLNIKFPIETSNYLFTEEDMFILLFCLLCIFILLVSYAINKSNRKGEEYYDDDYLQYYPQYN